MFIAEIQKHKHSGGSDDRQQLATFLVGLDRTARTGVLGSELQVGCFVQDDQLNALDVQPRVRYCVHGMEHDIGHARMAQCSYMDRAMLILHHNAQKPGLC